MKVRGSDNRPHPDSISAEPHRGSFVIDDATGFVSASAPAAEIIDAAPLAAGLSNGITLTVASGRQTIARAGVYDVKAVLGHFVASAAQVLTVELYKNAAVLSTALGAVKFQKTTTAAAVDNGVLSGKVECDVGDFLDLRVTISSGTLTVKSLRFEVDQVADDAVPSPA